MKRSIAARLLVILASASCGGGALQHGTAPSRDRWVQLDTPHFAISTNLDDATANGIATSLEQVRASLLALAWTGAKDPRGRTPVVVFERPSEFEHYIGRDHYAGIAISRPGFERTLSFRPGGSNGVPPVAIHEMTHDLSQWFMPIQPLWFAEGLAEYLATFSIDADAQQATMGKTSDDNIRWLTETHVFIRSARLFEATSTDISDPREQASFYASSWLLVHYLLHEQPEAFGKFQLGLTRLVPWREAWAAAFPDLTPEKLDEQVMDYVAKNRFMVVSDHVDMPRFETHQRTLSDAEGHGVLSRLSSALDLPVGESEMAEALRLDPNELNALVVRYHSAAAASDEARLDVARRAVAAHPGSGEAWLLAAMAEPTASARSDALRQAERLSPDHPLLARLLAGEAVSSGHSGQALEYSALALRRSPLTADLLALHVTALAGRHHCSTALSLTNSASALFGPTCSLRLGDRDIPCADYVRDAMTSSGACEGTDVAAARPPRRAPRARL
jgi:hypothetical protein